MIYNRRRCKESSCYHSEAVKMLVKNSGSGSVVVLSNNAGIMALEDKATKDGYDVQMQTNHISHFLLTKELYPLLKQAKDQRGEARVANHSSEARHQGNKLEEKYFGKNGGDLGGNGASMFFAGARWVRYQQSKLANTVFTKALANKFGDSGIIAAVAHPGLAATNLQTTTASTGGMGSGMWFMRMSQSQEECRLSHVALMLPPSMGPFGHLVECSNTLDLPCKLLGTKSQRIQNLLISCGSY